MTETHVGVFVSAFVVSALAGLAALLRTKEKIGVHNVLAALFNSGFLGLGISLLWYNQYRDNIYFLVGICVVAGLGGMATVEFVLMAIKKGGFSIKFSADGNAEMKGKSDEPQ